MTTNKDITNVVASKPGLECCMCGDYGFSHELFQCEVCEFRSQHRYCSNLYPKDESYRICNWCLSQKQDPKEKSQNSSNSSSSNKNQGEDERKNNKRNGNGDSLAILKGQRSTSQLKLNGPIKKQIRSPGGAPSPSARKRIITNARMEENPRRTKAGTLVAVTQYPVPSSFKFQNLFVQYVTIYAPRRPSRENIPDSKIWANRQSAARSKERKMRYIAELERKVQTLQTEATSLSAQLTLLQRDTNGLTAENSELKLRLQTMEQQVHFQDALNDSLKGEIQHFKVLTGQAMPNGGPMMNFLSFGAGQQFYSNNQAMHTHLTTQQFQQLQIHSQKLQQQHQLPQHSLHKLQQQIGSLKIRGSMSSTSQKENAADVNPDVIKEC